MYIPRQGGTGTIDNFICLWKQQPARKKNIPTVAIVNINYRAILPEISFTGRLEFPGDNKLRKTRAAGEEDIPSLRHSKMGRQGNASVGCVSGHRTGGHMLRLML